VPSSLAASHQRLRSLVNGHKIARAVITAARLGIIDRLMAEPLCAADLARQLDLDEGNLRRFLQLLCAIGLLILSADGTYSPAEMGTLLGRDREESDYAWVLKEAGPWWEGWECLEETLRTGRPGFEMRHGQGLFSYLAAPDNSELAKNALAALSSAASPQEIGHIVAKLSTFEITVAVDVGGGNGDLLFALLRDREEARGVHFDLPYVSEAARERAAQKGLAGRCAFVGGDFFSEIPAVPGADTYLLRSVLHDWLDADAIRILANCRAAMASSITESRLLIIEVLLGGGSGTNDCVTLDEALRDLNLMVMMSGRKRSVAQFEFLFKKSGFVLRRCIERGEGTFSVLEAGLA
jgi:hypothetical protein